MESTNFSKIEAKFTIEKNSVQKNLQILKADAENFNKIINTLVEQNYRLAFLFGTDDRAKQKTFGVHAFLAPQNSDEWIQVSTALPQEDPRYPALTKTILATIWYEKYLMDMFGIIAEGHPDPRRLVNHENVPLGTYPLRKDFAWNTKMKHANIPYPMMHVEGNGIFEIPVGPIHAGIIEPGHFRFNVAGERIVNLEGKLFFTHKGVEKILEEKTVEEALPFIERISDDSGASHPLAFVQTIETITGCQVSSKAKLLRTLVAELERITMHIHDIANIAGMGTGYTIMAAQGFKIKEDVVRLSEELLGNRFWRGLIDLGGVKKDFNQTELNRILSVLEKVMFEMRDVIQIGLDSDGLLERMVTTGILKAELARVYGAVGIPFRATDQVMDTRLDHPYASYDQLKFKVITKTGGDVFARFMVRVEELEVSFEMVKNILNLLPRTEGELKTKLHLKSGEALGAVEGWRGEILHFVRLDSEGKIERIAVRDPSFCNWPLFGEIGPGNIVPDFPLCNKSLNLSYSGCDL